MYGKEYISEPEEEIAVSNPATALKLLRNFGHLFEDLAINFKCFNINVCAEIELYLSKYCSKSLQRMSIICNSVRAALDGLQTPLIKLNLLRVEIDPRQHPDFRRLSENVPNLRYLYVKNDSKYIEHFERTHFENVEHFGINCGSSPCSALPFSFNKLKHFYFGNHRGIILNKYFYEFLTSAKYLTKLELMEIDSIIDNTFDDILQSEHFLTNIEEITVCMSKIVSPESVIGFLKQSKSLKKFTIYKCYTNNETHSNIIRTITSGVEDTWNLDVKIINNYTSHYEFYSTERNT